MVGASGFKSRILWPMLCSRRGWLKAKHPVGESPPNVVVAAFLPVLSANRMFVLKDNGFSSVHVRATVQCDTCWRATL